MEAGSPHFAFDAHHINNSRVKDMTTSASATVKWAYCLVLFFAVIPLGLAGSSWVALARGGVAGAWPVIGILPLLVLAVYRIYLVVRVPGTLRSFPPTGFARALRVLGVVGLFLGAAVSIANLAAGPLMRALITTRTDSGVEYFVVGLYLSMLSGIGTFGLLCYELSRLVAFEQNAHTPNAMRK